MENVYHEERVLWRMYIVKIVYHEDHELCSIYKIQ